MNAVRHGLLARCVVLDNESRDCFDQVVTQYLDCFRPANDVELGMIEEMIAAAWRQRRAWAIETSLMDTAISRQPGGDELIRIAAAYTSLSQQPQSALISRYEARLHRMFRHALNNLLLVRTIARPNEPDEPARTPRNYQTNPTFAPSTRQTPWAFAPLTYQTNPAPASNYQTNPTFASSYQTNPALPSLYRTKLDGQASATPGNENGWQAGDTERTQEVVENTGGAGMGMAIFGRTRRTPSHRVATVKP